MAKRWAVQLAGALLLSASCGGCWWSLFEHSRFSYRYDIGDGRTLAIWSIRRDMLGDWLRDGVLETDPNPLMIWYRIDSGGTELTPTTLVNHDDGRDYRFSVLSAAGGQLVCVYDAERGHEAGSVTILYDAASGESWPRDNANWVFEPEVKRKWRERFERVEREHPEFRMPRGLR